RLGGGGVGGGGRVGGVGAAGLAAGGAAGIPGAGLVTMVSVVTAVNTSLAGRGIQPLPLEAIGVIIGVDRILDMCRTTVNVWGDAVGARIITRLAPDDDDPDGTPALQA
ncbi:MAG: dicarboxylate/amino acid:cation symporter, partial [Phycisphaeraceae bacterium]|nr:dicarboxylate/amino acid:cation symporter [Phycisphaeraceae bacterium]